MSGTSLDGIDAALLNFGQHPRLLHHHSHPLPADLRARLLQLALNQDNVNLDMLGETDAELGDLFADAVNILLAQSGYNAQDIRGIGSHGQTIRHQPAGPHPFTLQIGDANRIAYKTGITTVADFRRKDMAAGGQGAPLTPAFHHAFFRSDKENRAVLNIGGIANITYLPADTNNPDLGFDTGPGNMLMDAWIAQHQQKSFDKDGAWAASAKPHQALLNQLMHDAFINRPPPKSTGREHYNLDWLNSQLKNIRPLTPDTIQATLCTYTAKGIEYAIHHFLPEIKTLIVCGGGAHNQHLIKQLQNNLQPVHVVTSSAYHLHPDWVEAAAFAWLAKQTLSKTPINLSEITGARQAVILGSIYLA